MITFKQYLLEQNNLQQRVAKVVAGLLDSPETDIKTVQLDTSLLDTAKEEEGQRIPAGTGAWVIRLFKTFRNKFVQVVPPKGSGNPTPAYYASAEDAPEISKQK